MPIGRALPKVRRLGVVIGKPLDFSRFAGLEGDRFILRSITDEIMYELSRLSGQEYVDVYASSVKDRSAVKEKVAAKEIAPVMGHASSARNTTLAPEKAVAVTKEDRAAASG
jgi:hypothetical protein